MRVLDISHDMYRWLSSWHPFTPTLKPKQSLIWKELPQQEVNRPLELQIRPPWHMWDISGSYGTVLADDRAVVAKKSTSRASIFRIAFLWKRPRDCPETPSLAGYLARRLCHSDRPVNHCERLTSSVVLALRRLSLRKGQLFLRSGPYRMNNPGLGFRSGNLR
jgi:hypothetical protein